VDPVGAVWTRVSGLSPPVASVFVLEVDELGTFGVGSPENMVLGVRVDRTAMGLRVALDGLLPDALSLSLVGLCVMMSVHAWRTDGLRTVGYSPTLRSNMK
jgi:hypothetical protein